MSIVYVILLDAAKILAFLLIILSFVVSLLVLFKPTLIVQLSEWLNTSYSTEAVSKVLDSKVDSAETILKYRWLVGTVFLAGSLFTARFVLVDFDPKRFVETIISRPGTSEAMIYGMLFSFLKWLIVVCSSVGVVVCLCLMFFPERFKKISDWLDTFVSTEKIGTTMDASHHFLDSWVYKHHGIVGLLLFLASGYLVVAYIFLYR